MASLRTTLLLAATLLFASAPDLAHAQNHLRVQHPQQAWRSAQGTIEEATLSIRPKGLYVEYGLYLTFSARGGNFSASDSLEVQLFFTMPEDVVVTDSWLWVGDDIIRADIMDLWTASSIYEEIVSRRQDPSILYKRGQGRYELRIYPMAGNETRKVKLTYLAPTQWTASTVSASLPAGLLRLSRHPVSKLHLMVWPAEPWLAPTLIEQPAVSFTPRTDPELGTYLWAALPGSAADGALTVAWEAPLQNGHYLSRHEAGEGGWYQMALLPSSALDRTVSRRVALLIDHDATKAGVPAPEVLRTARSLLQAGLSPADSFNVIVSGLNLRPVSDTWLRAAPAVIDSVFDALDRSGLASYSNLPALLDGGVRFVGARGGGSLLLLASSDQVGAAPAANELLRDLQASTTALPPLHVVDFTALGAASRHFIGGRNYRGNEYFYTNVTRLTGGRYLQARDGPSFSRAVQDVLGSLGGVIRSLDLHTTLAYGFSFGRFSAAPAGQLAYLDRPLLQVGRYVGSFPFVVEVSGLYESAPFTMKRTIDASESFASDTTLASLWTGLQIQALEREPQTNDIISQIIDYSLHQRVLSRYTAFLALEPSRGGQVCHTCVDETGTVPSDTEEETDLPEEAVLTAYPNPFSTEVTIEVELPALVDAARIDVRIYNVMGQVVRTLRPSASGPVRQFRLTWDGTGDAGQPLASGTYFLVLTTPQGRHTLPLVLVR